MGLAAFVALVRKDLQLFFSDRRAVILTFAVPIAIASFFGSIFRGASDNDEPAKIAVAIVDRDGSAISKSILAGIRADRSLDTSDGRCDVPGDQRLVRLANSARLELRHQRPLRPVVLGDHQEAARVAVEAMHDAGASDTRDAAVLRRAGPGKECIDERVAVVVSG